MVTELLTLAFVAAMPVNPDPESERYIKSFPPAKEGMVRYVIQLPKKDREEEMNFGVELIVGQEMLTDGVNRIGLGGKIETKTLQGFGFNYYEIEKLGPAMSTLIGVPPGTPKVNKFVAGPSQLIRYNSRVPVVIYVPEDAEVRYRIWEAPEKTEPAPKR